jgi:hypothetical protein
MLAQDQVDAYRRDGVLLVKGLIRGSELAALQAAADEVTDRAVVHGRRMDAERGPIRLKDDHGFTEWQEFDENLFLYGRGKQGERVFRRAEGMFGRDPVFGLASAHPRLRSIVETIVGQPVVAANDSLVVKMPGAGAAVPWHRDPSGETLLAERGDASSDFTCDIYLDRSTVANGCVWALPGSHRTGGPTAPDDPLDFDVPGAVPLEAEPGDLLLHSTGVLHGSPTNTSSSMRRTLYLHYRPPAELTGGFWQRPQDWIDQRVAAFEALVQSRAVAEARA